MRIWRFVVFASTLAACAAAPADIPPIAPAPIAPSQRAMPSAPPAASTCDRVAPASCGASPPSFATDVRPILERRCFTCHANDGEAADEHDFSRFETLFAQRRGVVAELTACAMPPARASTLTTREAEVILHWIVCGANAH